MNKINIGNVILGILIGVAITLVATSNSNGKKSNSEPSAKASSDTTSATASIENSPLLGDKNAKVGIVEFSDFECPYCQKFEEQTFDQLNDQFIKTNKAFFVYRNFPLEFHQPAANTDANAALCVKNLKDDKAFFDFAKLVYQNTGLNGKGIPTDQMVKFAGQVGVDSAKFSSCLSANTYNDQIKKDTEAGTKAGVSGTPSFVIGKLNDKGEVVGELLVGALPVDSFRDAINKYL